MAALAGRDRGVGAGGVANLIRAGRSEWRAAPGCSVGDTWSMSIDPATRIGAVRLAVAELDRAREFYERTIGLRTLERSDGAERLGADGTTVVELIAEPGGAPRPAGTTGLFHLAILVPGRRELARSLRRLAESRWPLAGASDHLVSEALYLADPDRDGIEIYRDRPRGEWRMEGGTLQMATLPLDLDALLGEPDESDGPPAQVAAGTRIGHVHLHVSDLAAAERFYVDALGFEVTVRDYPGALFVSAGGYHHHVGLNTWAGEGAPAPPPGSLGLRWFEVLVPDRGELERIERRLSDAGVEAKRHDDGILTTDPSRNGVLLRAAAN
jgi:catechol 2,3-dioxygenase